MYCGKIILRHANCYYLLPTFLHNQLILFARSLYWIWFLWNVHLQVSIFFDLLFIVQHYVLYPAKKTALSPDPDTVSQEPLLKSSDGPQKEQV